MNELKGIISCPSQYEDRRNGGPRTLPNLSLFDAAHNLNTFASSEDNQICYSKLKEKVGKTSEVAHKAAGESYKVH